MAELFVAYAAYGALCAVAAGVIAVNKQRGGLDWAVLGFLGGIIAIIVIAALPPGQLTPSGMRAVTCPRCSARQNVPSTNPSYVCWQCQLTAEATPAEWTEAVAPRRSVKKGALIGAAIGLVPGLLGGTATLIGLIEAEGFTATVALRSVLVLLVWPSLFAGIGALVILVMNSPTKA